MSTTCRWAALTIAHVWHSDETVFLSQSQSYVEHFKLDSGRGWDGQPGRFRMSTRVVKIDKHPAGGHAVTLQRKQSGTISRTDSGVDLPSDSPADEPSSKLHKSLIVVSPLIGESTTAYTLHADAVAICSGLHVTPAWPDIPGIEYIPETLHSSAYKGREQLVGKRVMILGCGETAMDLAYESCKAGAKEVTLCYRGGYLSFPKVLNSFEMFGVKFDGELPIDGLITVSHHAI